MRDLKKIRLHHTIIEKISLYEFDKNRAAKTFEQRIDCSTTDQYSHGLILPVNSSFC